MKKSQLRKLIREEVQKLNEDKETDFWQYIFDKLDTLKLKTSEGIKSFNKAKKGIIELCNYRSSGNKINDTVAGRIAHDYLECLSGNIDKKELMKRTVKTMSKYRKK